MFFLANIVLSIGFIWAAQDKPFKYDISPEINPQSSNYMDQVKDELLSKLIQNTLERSIKDKSKLEKNLIESNLIVDEALVEPFTDKYDKYFSTPLDQGVRMKRAGKLFRSTDTVPAEQVPVEEEEESVHGFVRQLIPSLLPIPHDANSLKPSITKPRFEDEFKDIVNVSSISGREDKTNLTTNGVDGHSTGINSTNTTDGIKEEEEKKEDDKKDDIEDNGKYDNKTQPSCPTVNPIATTPAPSDRHYTTVRFDIISDSKPTEPKPTPRPPINPPPHRNDGEVICTDRMPGQNCSQYIISLYDDKVAMYLKITSSLKSDVIKPYKPYIPKYPTNQLSYYVGRTVDNTATYVPKSTKMTTPFYKTSPPKYFNAAKMYVKPTSMYATTPAMRSASVPTNRVPMNSPRRILPMPYTTPKYMKQRRIQAYPTQRPIPEPTNILQKPPPQQSIPMRHMTPRSASVQKKNLPTHTTQSDIPELANQLRHKLKLLRNLSATKPDGKRKLQNHVKQNIPDARLVSKHYNKITATNNRKQKTHASVGKRPITQKSVLENMIVPPKQKYRPNSYPFPNKYGPVQSPKPDHLPGVISGLTKREGVTFFNYYPFPKSASRKRVKRSVAESKSQNPHNFFMFSF